VVRFQVLECEPPSRLAYSCAAGPIIDTQVIYRLEPDGDGTRFWPAMSERSESNGGGGNCTVSRVSLTICPKCGYNMAPGSWPEMGRGGRGTPRARRNVALPDAFRQGHHHGPRPARLNLGPRISGLRLLDHRCIGFEQDVDV
jgi:hypothetical protein